MSTLEKLLVLGVLVLVGVILAISLFWTRDDAVLGDGLGETALSSKVTPAASPLAAPAETAPPELVAPPPVVAASPVVAPPAAVVTPSPLVKPSPSPEFWVYTVQHGDTPTSISTKLAGTKDFGRLIDRANESQPLVPGRPILIPHFIFANRPAAAPPMQPSSPLPAGDALAAGTVPTLERSVAPSPVPAAVRTSAPKPESAVYVVKRGDNLRRIARTQLKDERRWKEIRELNGLSGDAIREGQKLQLPL